MTLTDQDRAVLAAYVKLDDADHDGAFAPYHADVAAAAGGSIYDAYAACKRLKAAGALACDGRQAVRVFSAPNYWVLPKGRELAGAEEATR